MENLRNEQTMRKSKFTRKPIIAILAERKRGMATSRRVSASRGVSSAYVLASGRASMGGMDCGRPKAEDAGGREAQLKKAAGRQHARQTRS